jgi:hypothetical protein
MHVQGGIRKADKTNNSLGEAGRLKASNGLIFCHFFPHLTVILKNSCSEEISKTPFSWALASRGSH